MQVFGIIQWWAHVDALLKLQYQYKSEHIFERVLGRTLQSLFSYLLLFSRRE
jgi:hypothetical protein